MERTSLHQRLRINCYYSLSLFFLFAPFSSSLLPIGIHPLDEKYYATKVIKCRDGSKAFTRDPCFVYFAGTSACPTSKFYCKNVGSIPQFLFSSRVNDHICGKCNLNWKGSDFGGFNSETSRFEDTHNRTDHPLFHSSVLLLLESGDAVICGIGAVRRASGEEIRKAVAMILVLETADSCWVGKQSIVALYPEAQGEDPIIVDHEGEEELDKSAMPKSGAQPAFSHLTHEPIASTHKKKKGWPKKQKAIEKKVQTLIENLKPIPFKPPKTLNFGKHEKLLKRLGLWDFVHIEFDREVRVDLIAQLIANYEARSSYVNGLRVAVNRADLGRAFKLPVKKEKGGGSVSSEAVDLDSEGHVDIANEVVNWTKAVKDGHPEKVDWAGLIWFMVEKELNQGNKLKECYYASHLQHLIRSQREELFREENREEVGVEVKDEDDGGDVEIEDGARIKSGNHGGSEEEEVDGEIKMGEEPVVEARVEVKEEEEDSGEVKMGKEPTVELGVDVKEEEGGGKVTMEKQPMVDVGLDVKDDEDGGDGVDVKEEVEFGEEPMVEAGVEVKEEEDGGGEMKMDGFDDFQGQQLEGNVMGEELNVELTLGKEIAEMEEQDADVKEGDMMDVEDSEADEQEQGQWLLDGKNSAGDHFLQRCNIDASTVWMVMRRGNQKKRRRRRRQSTSRNGDNPDAFFFDRYTWDFGWSSIFGHGSFGHGSKREIVHEDDILHKRIRSDGPWSHKSSDFEMCMEEMQHWMGKARMVYQEKENAFEVSNTSQQLLLGEIQRRDDLIEHLQKTKREEIQKKDGEIYRLERELYLMGSLLDGYRKAVKETQKSFFEYRQQCQLLEEPVYKDAGPGGLVLSTTELEKQQQKREEEEKMVRMVLEQKVKEFEENVFGKIEEKMEAHFNDVLKLNKRLMDAGNEFKLLKELSRNPRFR
ncbi:hypothetical protein C3L33_12028, partial [Rhododendron williamsianum]